MTSFAVPLREMKFTLDVLGGLDPDALTPDLVDAVLEGAARFATEVLAPLNHPGDREGARLEGEVVRTPAGFAAAYRAFVEAGWNAVPFDPEFGGQGLPWALAFAVQEMWQSANMGFGLCPLLNQGAVEALTLHGSPAQKAMFLPHLISGGWTGTMNLTEPQAGSDLGAVRTRAVPDGTGHQADELGPRYRLFGQKIYITYGEHDFTPNIVHMVLARIEGAPAGVKGISLFIAPKFLPDPQGEPGARNDLRCVSLEHKLGIHASPTAVMAFGDDDGAVAWLVGEPNRGLEYMFTMMNNARLGVGVQGVAIGARAYAQALDYARGRMQGRTLLAGNGAIFDHPDIRRTLLGMKALVEAGRGLACMAGAALDRAHAAADEEARRLAQARVELLTPIVKAWCTDRGVEVASMGVQVHGGMGFIEETGAAQHYRDARIAPIYEGTNGIQANDLLFRKTVRDQGVAARAFVAEMRAVAAQAESVGDPSLQAIGVALGAAVSTLDPVIDWMVAEGAARPAEAAAGAAAYLELFGLVAGGAVLARLALAAQARQGEMGQDAAFAQARLATALFYAQTLLPRSEGLAAAALSAHRGIGLMPPDAF